MRHLTVKSKKAMDELIRGYRDSGFNLITYGKKLSELENENEMIVIEVISRKKV